MGKTDLLLKQAFADPSIRPLLAISKDLTEEQRLVLFETAEKKKLQRNDWVATHHQPG